MSGTRLTGVSTTSTIVVEVDDVAAVVDAVGAAMSLPAGAQDHIANEKMTAAIGGRTNRRACQRLVRDSM